MNSLSTLLGKALGYAPSWLTACFRHDSLGSRLLRPVLNPLLPAGHSWGRVASGPCRGIWLLLDLKGEKGFLTGRREEEFQDALSRAIRPGASYWDVGANVGFYTMLGSRLVGPGGRVVAIEPDPENANRLRAAVEKNGFRNVEVAEVALSSSEGVMALERHGAMSRLQAAQNVDGTAMVPVTVSTMEKLAERFGVPDVVKIDVEGAEVDVLRGMGPHYQDRKPLFLIEFHSKELLEEAKGLLPDYEFRPIDAEHWWLEPKEPLR
ncbi:FkbM family methyltransferase [Verrucomicrobium sp. 3C]|uniref:FkbM family methyltransferase n=1 Tax=Verrucomicrobium sp. 3C TaxID=1134055 RepID=UPI000365125E|nr:FkbM family methyltransferase [Verrucomicrobium sp. 3C]